MITSLNSHVSTCSRSSSKVAAIVESSSVRSWLIRCCASWLRSIASLTPVTYAIDSMRALMIGGWTWGAIAGSLFIVSLFSAIVAGVSTAIFVRRVELSTL